MAVESKVRSEVLGTDLVTVPQHLILTPQGKLLEAREYYLSVAVLERFLRKQLGSVRPDLALGKDVAAEVSQGKIGDRLREALRSEDREKRAAAIRILGDFDPDDIMREMDATFASMSAKEKSAMLLALGAPGFRAAVPILSRHLVGTDAQMRASAALALGRLGDTQAIIPLRRRLSTEPDAVARGCVVDALASFASKDELAAKAVVQAAGDRDLVVRAHACLSLADIDGSAAEQTLLKALDAKDRSVVGAAVWACGKRKLKAAEKKLKELVKAYPDIRFKVVAEAAMKRIRGEPVDDAFYDEQKAEFLQPDTPSGK
ncbi:MAG: HEAT repeat domain-containing protein [Planctomycetota bacterium]